jgi:hypothetical protein
MPHHQSRPPTHHDRNDAQVSVISTKTAHGPRWIGSDHPKVSHSNIKGGAAKARAKQEKGGGVGGLGGLSMYVLARWRIEWTLATGLNIYECASPHPPLHPPMTYTAVATSVKPIHYPPPPIPPPPTTAVAHQLLPRLHQGTGHLGRDLGPRRVLCPHREGQEHRPGAHAMDERGACRLCMPCAFTDPTALHYIYIVKRLAAFIAPSLPSLSLPFTLPFLSLFAPADDRGAGAGGRT